MKTKQLILSITPVIAFFLSSAEVYASDTFAQGDLLVGFYEITGSGSTATVGPETLVLNLGPAHLYRENTQNNVAVGTINGALPGSNISTDLANTFGADWANDATSSVYWFVVGGVTQAGGPTNGDPTQTTYFSKARTNLTTGTSGPGSNVLGTLGEYERADISLGLTGFSSGINDAINGINGGTATSGVNTALAVIPVGNVNTMDEYLPPGTLTYFGISENPRQRMTTGVIAGGTSVEGALNIFRYLNTNAGADLTSGASSGNAVAGTPQFIGTLTIDSSGNLKITAIPSAVLDSDSDGLPDSWENTYFGGLTQGAADDFDRDGTNNLTEYRLGLIPNSGLSFFATSRNATSGQLSWSSVVGVTFKVYRSTTLADGSWSDIATIAGTAGTATYTDPTPPAGKAFYRVGLQP